MGATARQDHALLEKAHRVLPGGSFGNTSADIIIRTGRGSRVWDENGNEYVDYLTGSGPMLVGHAHPDVMAAVRAQIERGAGEAAIHIDPIRCAPISTRAPEAPISLPPPKKVISMVAALLLTLTVLFPTAPVVWRALVETMPNGVGSCQGRRGSAMPLSARGRLW